MMRSDSEGADGHRQFVISRALSDVLVEMQQLQRHIASDGQPVSMHELDSLKRLGVQYAELVESLARLRAGAAAESGGE